MHTAFSDDIKGPCHRRKDRGDKDGATIVRVLLDKESRHQSVLDLDQGRLKVRGLFELGQLRGKSMHCRVAWTLLEHALLDHTLHLRADCCSDDQPYDEAKRHK